MNRFIRVFVIFAAVSIAIFSAAKDASALVLRQTTEEMTINSDRILTGDVTAIKSEWDPERTTIYTYVTVSVDRHIKGDPDLDEVVIRVPGGTVGDVTIKVMDVAQFNPKEKVMVFLQHDQSDSFMVTGWHQGKFSIKDNMVMEKKEPVGGFEQEINAILNKKMQEAGKGSPSLVKKESAARRRSAAMAGKIFQKKMTGNSSSHADISGWQDIMTENFEGTFPSTGWQVFDNGQYAGVCYWGKDDYKPYAGSYSAWCARSGTNGVDPQYNNYPNNCESWAVYGPFDLSNAGAADVSFKLWLDTEPNNDWVFAMASSDGINFSGYGYAGNSGGWYSGTLDLSAYLGDSSVWIAAIFISNATNNNYKGAFIDDVVLRKNVNGANPPAVTSINPNKASAGTGTRVTVNGSNFGASQGSGKVTFFYASGHSDIEADIVSWSDTSIECVVPADASSGALKVINDNDISNGAQFTVTFGYAGMKWYAADIPVAYYINEGGTSGCAGEFTAITNAFTAWAAASNGGMEFIYEGTTTRDGSNHNDGYNVISWGSAPQGAIAVTYITYTAGKILETDMIFSNALPWSDSGEAGKYDVQDIATHEAGHFLVLSDLYGTADAEKTMYGFGATGETKKRTLEADDIAGTAYIYPAQGLPFVTADLDGGGQQDVVIDFGSTYGIWIYYNNSTWQQLHTISPVSMTAGNLDSDPKKDLIVDFGTQYGIWIYYNNSTWQQLHSISAESITAADLDHNGQDDIVVDFGSTYGVWIYYNNSTWTQLHTISPTSMTAGNLDSDPKKDLIIDFGSQYGIWIYYNDSTWQQLHSISAESIVTADLDHNGQDDIVVDFGSTYGIWIYYNNSTWQQLHSISPKSITAGNLDSDPKKDLIVDFGSQYGIWIYYNNSTWTQLHGVSADFITTGDMNASGQDEIIIDFGPQYGVWVYYDDGVWIQLHNISP